MLAVEHRAELVRMASHTLRVHALDKVEHVTAASLLVERVYELHDDRDAAALIDELCEAATALILDEIATGAPCAALCQCTMCTLQTINYVSGVMRG